MKKTIAIVLVVVLLLVGITACPMESEDNGSAPTDSSTTAGKYTPTTVHIHKYKGATCVDPKICTDCGETSGHALGHDWDEATCVYPKTCSVCKKTEGNAIGHDYENGVCAVCGKKDPSIPVVKMVWIPTNGGTKYHSKSSCSNMKNPTQVSLDEAEDLGYTACQKCF